MNEHRDREIRKSILDDVQYLVRKLGVSPEVALDKTLAGWSIVPPEKNDQEAFLLRLESQLVSCKLTPQEAAEATSLVRLIHERGASDEQALKALDRINHQPRIASVLGRVLHVFEFEFVLFKLTAEALVKCRVKRRGDLPGSVRNILDKMADKAESLLKDIRPVEGKRKRKPTRKRKPRKPS